MVGFLLLMKLFRVFCKELFHQQSVVFYSVLRLIFRKQVENRISRITKAS